jgi:hypothetical protein
LEQDLKNLHDSVVNNNKNLEVDTFVLRLVVDLLSSLYNSDNLNMNTSVGPPDELEKRNLKGNQLMRRELDSGYELEIREQIDENQRKMFAILSLLAGVQPNLT